jgi:hypothetical protein
MNKTEIKFYESKEEYLGVTDFIHFGRAIFASGLNRSTIQRRMSKVLNKRDYPDFTLDEMLDHFEFLSKLKNQ